MRRTRIFTRADKLIEEIGLLDNVHEWAGKVYIINPISTQYNNDDVTAFKKLAGTGVSNIKVIGIDEVPLSSIIILVKIVSLFLE